MRAGEARAPSPDREIPHMSLKGQLAAHLQREAAGRMLNHHNPFRSRQNGRQCQRDVAPLPDGPHRYQKRTVPTWRAALAVAPVAGSRIKVVKGNKKNKCLAS